MYDARSVVLAIAYGTRTVETVLERTPPRSSRSSDSDGGTPHGTPLPRGTSAIDREP